MGTWLTPKRTSDPRKGTKHTTTGQQKSKLVAKGRQEISITIDYKIYENRSYMSKQTHQTRTNSLVRVRSEPNTRKTKVEEGKFVRRFCDLVDFSNRVVILKPICKGKIEDKVEKGHH